MRLSAIVGYPVSVRVVWAPEICDRTVSSVVARWVSELDAATAGLVLGCPVMLASGSRTDGGVLLGEAGWVHHPGAVSIFPRRRMVFNVWAIRATPEKLG